MLRWSIHQTEHPVAIRVPNVPLEAANDTVTEESYGDLNRYQITHKGSEIAILGLGGYYALAQKVAEKYKEKFKYPERIAKVNGEIVAVPFKPKTKEAER